MIALQKVFNQDNKLTKNSKEFIPDKT